MRQFHNVLLIAVATLSASALVACGEKASEQKSETLKGEGFTVRIPGKPKRTTQTVPTGQGPIVLTAYTTEGGSEGFSMSVAKLPPTAQGDLDGAVQGGAAQVKGTAKETVKTTYQGFPARDARITNAQDKNGNKGTVFARLILAKGKLFQLQFIQEGGDVKKPPAAYPAFLASLKIS